MTSPSTVPLDGPKILDLLSRRRALIQEIADIDAALSAQGLVATAPNAAPRESRVTDLVVALVGAGIASPPEIAERTGQTINATYQMLYRLVRAERLIRTRSGAYALPRDAA